MPPANNPGVQFIVSTDVKKADPQTRKLIRSHVMRGKNRGVTCNAKRQKPTQTAVLDIKKPQRAPLTTLIERGYSIIPRKVGSDTSFIEFADGIEPATILDLVEFSCIAIKVMFPLVAFIDFGNDKMWFELLTLDAAYLHITVFGIETFINNATGRHHNTIQEPTFHFMKGLQLLRKRLLETDSDSKVSDSTLIMVVTLAIYAHAMGDYKTAKHHMEGIRTITNLRGGLKSFRGTKLPMEVLRYDLSIAIHSGSKPLFFNEAFLEPFIPFPDQKLWLIQRTNANEASKQRQQEFLSHIDGSLASAWTTMQGFCSLVSLAAETQRMLSPEIIHDTMASVMYRLLQTNFQTGSINETIQLGLLALCYKVFLQWENMNLSHLQFSSIYSSHIRGLKASEYLSPHAIIWLLVVGRISVLTGLDDIWLRDLLFSCINSCKVKSWSEMRSILKSFIWIGALYDKEGKMVFDSVCTA